MADKPKGPLDGVRVCDLTHALSGPYCTMMIGDMGAEVIKIEMPGRGDESRHWGPPFIGDQSAYFLCCNRNKKGLTLDLKSGAGKEAFRRLVESSDVLVENFAPGVMERLGFSYQEMKKINPGLVYCSISGFGQDGPKKLYTAYDIIVQGMSGVMSLTGQDDGPPTQVGIPITDIVAGMHSAFAISNALLYKSKTGEGQYIDTSMIGGALSILVSHGSSFFATGKVPGVQGTQHGMIAPYGTFKTGSGRINIAVGNDMIWDRFCDAIGMGIEGHRRRAPFQVHSGAGSQGVGQGQNPLWPYQRFGPGVCGSAGAVP
jgi:formyl-CoA transferase